MQAVERRPYPARAIWCTRIDKTALRFVGDRLEKIRLVSRDHDVPVLVAFLGHHPVLDDWYRRSGRSAEADGDDGQSELTCAMGFAQHLVGIVEPLAVAHQDDCLVALRFVEREKIRPLTQSAGERAATLADDSWVEVLKKQV